jgi:hypothetical protein
MTDDLSSKIARAGGPHGAGNQNGFSTEGEKICAWHRMRSWPLAVSKKWPPPRLGWAETSRFIGTGQGARFLSDDLAGIGYPPGGSSPP